MGVWTQLGLQAASLAPYSHWSPNSLAFGWEPTHASTPVQAG